MKRIIPLLLLVASSLGFGKPADAQESLAKYIERFNSVVVNLGPGSDGCGIRDKERYAATVARGLTDAGLKNDPIGLSTAYLFIWGTSFGPLNQQCAIFMSLRLGADVAGAAVSIESKLAEDQSLVQHVKAVEGTFPGTFWISSSLFVHVSGGTENAVNSNIDMLVNDFKKARGG